MYLVQTFKHLAQLAMCLPKVLPLKRTLMIMEQMRAPSVFPSEENGILWHVRKWKLMFEKYSEQ